MSYRDPYTTGGRRASVDQYNHGAAVEYYNPYQETHEPHRSYDQAGYASYQGYRDEPFQPPADDMDRSYPDTIEAANSKETGYGSAAALAGGTKGSSATSIRRWRYAHQGNLWTKGGRGRCFGRFCCCTLMTFVFLLVSIILSLALWIEPPNITIGDVQTPTSGSTLQITNDGLNLNFAVNIAVKNPNYFSVNVKQIQLDITYPINNTDVGGGTSKNINFKSDSTTSFQFPFTIEYKTSADPNYSILKDLAGKCGLIPSTAKSDIAVNYKLTLGLRVLFVTVSPSFSNKFTMACPDDTAQELKSVAQSAGINLDSILGLLTSSSS